MARPIPNLIFVKGVVESQKVLRLSILKKMSQINENGLLILR